MIVNAPDRIKTDPTSAGKPPYQPGLAVRKKTRRWIFAIPLSAMAVVAVWKLTHRAPPPAAAAAPEVSKTQLHETGMVEALVEWPVVARYGGDILWKIDEGSEVKPGDPVVKFDTDLVEEDISDRMKLKEGRLEAVRRAEAECAVNKRKYELTVRQQEIVLKLAQLDKELVDTYPLPVDRKDAALALKSASMDLKASEDDAASYDELVRRGFVSEAMRKKKQLELTTNKINYSKAKLINDLMLDGSTVDAKRLQEIAVADATKRLQIALYNRDADTALLQSALYAAKIDLENIEREIGRKQHELDLATVRAPAAGRVAFIDVWKGSKTLSPIQVGETRPGGSDCCKIFDTSRLRINVWIGEFNIWRVHKDQHVTVALTSFPGRTFNAVVSEIGAVATDKNTTLSPLASRSAGEAFVNVVGVKLDFQNLTEEERASIRIGMTADVLIELDPSTSSGKAPSAGSGQAAIKARINTADKPAFAEAK